MYNKQIKLIKNNAIGYWYFNDNNHPLSNSAGWVYYHRHVMSMKLGRWISHNEHVHHIDENKDNNLPENLELTDRSNHSKIHNEDKKLFKINCFGCGLLFKPIKSKQIYCSIRCYRDNYINRHGDECCKKGIRKFEVSKEELEKLVWEIPTSKVAKIFGVSDKAIEKRCKKFGINKPPRGYWQKIK